MEDDFMWTEAIERLRALKSIKGDAQDELSKIVKWSYDQVDADVKRVFLDVVILLRNQSWSLIEALGNTISKKLEARSLVNRKKSSLIFEEDNIEVHDLLVALAEQESNGTRVYSMDDSLSKEGIKLENVQGLCNPAKSDWDVSIESKELDVMSNNLRILHGLWHVRGECKEIPRSLQICVGRFPYRSLQGLTNLRVLEIYNYFPGEKIRMEFSDQIFPQALQIFKVINVEFEGFHQKAFDDCKSLHTLHISSCYSLKELPAGIWGLPKLRVLTLEYNGYQSLPSGLKGMSSLRHFTFKDSAHEEFLSAMEHLTNLVTVFIEGTYNLPGNLDLSRLLLLEHLKLKFNGSKFSADCEDSEAAPVDYEVSEAAPADSEVSEATPRAAPEMGKWQLGLGMLYALKSLSIEDLHTISGIGDDLSALMGLEMLSFRDCKGLTQLPKGLENLHSLSELILQGCKSLQSLPDAVCQLSSLRKMDLSSCYSLKELPEEFDQLKALTHLNLWHCSGLQSLPATFSQLPSLEDLDLTKCSSLRKVPGGFGNFSRLIKLTMWNMDAFEGFSDGFPNFTSLRFLSISGRLIQSNATSPLKSESLQTLLLQDWETFPTLTLFAESASLRSLQEVDLEACPQVKFLPESMLKLKSLKILYLGWYSQLRQTVLVKKLQAQNGVKVKSKDGGFGRYF